MDWDRTEDPDERGRIATEHLDHLTEGCFLAFGSHGVVVAAGLAGAVVSGPIGASLVAVGVASFGLAQWLWLLPLSALSATFLERRVGLGVLLGGLATMGVYGVLVAAATLSVLAAHP